MNESINYASCISKLKNTIYKNKFFLYIKMLIIDYSKYYNKNNK